MDRKSTLSMAAWLQDSSAQSPDVSVIIPTYNRVSMLEEALASALSQEFDGIVEIIVVDDNSQDRTSEMVSSKYSEIRLITLQQNVGAYAARNRAILEAKGKYIAFLDSDDFWEKNYLKTQISALDGKECCFCVSAIFNWFTLQDRKLIGFPKPDLEKYTSAFHHLLVQGSFIPTPSSVVLPRRVFDDVGLFDETQRMGGDCDLYTRCLLSGYQPICTELPLVTRRKHAQGQATDQKNDEARKRGGLSRVNKYHHLVEKHVDIPSIHHIYAEIHARYATLYLNRKKILPWLSSSLLSAYNASPGYALSNMWRDITDIFQTRVKKKLVRFFENSFGSRHLT